MGGHTFVGDELEHETAQSFIDLIYETAEGYISVAVQSNKEWAGLCRAFEKPEWQTDPRFATAALRHENIDKRLQMTQDMLMTRPATEWLERLEAEDVPCAPVLKRKEVIRHPQIVANDLVIESEHPHAGKLRQTRPAAQFSKTPASVRYPAPALGQHTKEEFESVGYTADELKALADDDVISF